MTDDIRAKIEKTGLPLIVDDEIIINAIEWHLMHYFFELLYLNYPEQSLLQRLQYLDVKKKEAFEEADAYVRLPSFKTMVDIARRARHSWRPYQLPLTHF